MRRYGFRWALELRREHLALEKCGLRFLPHALRRLQRTDPVRQSHDGRLSRNIPRSGRQADCAAIHLCAAIRGVALQRKPAGVRRRRVLGRARDRVQAGYPDAEQAQHRPVDTQEMGFPDTACVAWPISQAQYKPLFEQIWGSDFDIRWPSDTEQTCSTPEELLRPPRQSRSVHRPHQGKRYI